MRRACAYYIIDPCRTGYHDLPRSAARGRHDSLSGEKSIPADVGLSRAGRTSEFETATYAD